MKRDVSTPMRVVNNHFYAISQELMVVPEPNSAIGLVYLSGAFLFRRKKS